ncbi:MAG: metallophosphoesterase [Lachnospiraceae bacterium]|nr:metallophosphoesterase [Lachnospiraceae bacterium]
MIFITGDTHGRYKGRFNTEVLPEQNQMTKDDYVIVCGDFTLIGCAEETREEKYWCDWFESRSYTLLFIDGNHEHHLRLAGFPVKEWHGGKVHEIRPHVLHLMRGQVFELQGKTFFTFGGGQSHDLKDGILDPSDPDYKQKKRELRREFDPQYRIKGVSWFEEEMPTEEELAEGLDNLARHNNTVDYIVTHCCCTSTQALVGDPSTRANYLTDYFENIHNTVDYKKWFFGHYHKEIDVNDREFLLERRLIRIV